MLLTRMLSAASCCAIAFAEADLGGLDGVVGHAAADSRPQIDAIIRMTPPPAARMCGTASRDMRMAGNSVWSSALCQSASDVDDDVGAAGLADVVDEDVEPAEAFDGARDDGGGAGLGGHVRGDGQDAIAPGLGAEVGGGTIEGVNSTSGQGDATPFRDERARRGQAEAAAGSGHNGNFVDEFEVHIGCGETMVLDFRVRLN